MLRSLGKAESFEGAQTVIWYNAGKHTVDGTAYDDAAEFHLDQNSKNDRPTTTWFKDLYGNLIGVVEIATSYTYGVITAMWYAGDFRDRRWQGPSPMSSTLTAPTNTDHCQQASSSTAAPPSAVFARLLAPIPPHVMVATPTLLTLSKGTIALSYDSLRQNEYR